MEAAEQGRPATFALADRGRAHLCAAVHAWPWRPFWAGCFLGGAGWQDGAADRRRGSDHHLPLRAGPGGAGGPGRRQRAALRRGILLKSATRWSAWDIDTVVFDKTGTLTKGRPELIDGTLAEDDLVAAASIGGGKPPSTGPRAGAAPPCPVAAADRRPANSPAPGLPSRTGARTPGQPGAGAASMPHPPTMPVRKLARPGQCAGPVPLFDALRADAADVVARAKGGGLGYQPVVGRSPPAVAPVAEALGIDDWRGG